MGWRAGPEAAEASPAEPRKPGRELPKRARLLAPKVDFNPGQEAARGAAGTAGPTPGALGGVVRSSTG